MELGRFSWWVMLVLVQLCINGCFGCLEQEKIALLRLKASFNDPVGYSLPSWNSANEESECCDWEGVKCNITTGRVIQLALNNTGYRTREYVNASLFLPFEELNYLDLSWNGIQGCIPNEGFEKFSRLSKLEELHLDDNFFNISIFSYASGIPSLKKLYLRGNALNGSIHIQEFENFSNLEELYLRENENMDFITLEGSKSLTKLKVLDLSWNNFDARILESSAAIPSLKILNIEGNNLEGSVTTKALRRLNNLEQLYLDRSSINRSILHKAGVMTSLNVLTMSDCGLNGSLPAQGWCELKNLQELDLSNNNFEGILPACLWNLTSLRVLDLSFNKFLGDITHSQLSSLTSLEYLSLSNNYFNPIKFSLFSNLTNLKVLLSNKNKIVPETNNSETWTPTFQLKVFRMSQCLFNEPKRTPPRFLRYQYDLQVIDLSHNNLTGKFPIWLLDNNPKLEVLYLRNNSFTGPILLPSHSYPKIRRVDISNNFLEGPIPSNLDSIFPNLENLLMSRNAFHGSIPYSIGNLVSLKVLDLSTNHLSGTMPEHFTMGCYSLVHLKLSKNNFSGQIFPTSFNLTNLSKIYLDNNHFSGKIPNSLPSNSLSAIDFSNNNLSGKLPRWLGNMSYLDEISMAENLLEGHIPIELCQLDKLMFIDLSDNNLFGSIPSCFNSSGIKHVHLNKNRLSGPIASAFQDSSSLVTLNLRDNYLTGNIPDWIGSLSSLSILLLKGNLMEGRIPIQLCLLLNLSMLDLSYNNFFGPIPHCLSDISFEATNQKSDLGGDFVYDYDFEKTPLDYLETKIGNMRDTLFYFSAFPIVDAKQEVDFTTKSRTYSYAGDILNYMSGIDLSCNKLAGEIPPELGRLGNIHALNLSHNNLTGPIPTTFSNLKEIESLDLSYNNLNGRIPPQLIELTYLAVFSVAYNNLSGPTPDRKAQFGTFDERSYVGNSLLCGPPLHNSCTKTEPPFTMPVNHRGEEGGGFIDIDVFYISFVVAYIMMLLGIVVVLYINAHWRQAWFNFIEECIDTCYCFVLIHCRKLSNFRLV